MCGVRHYRWMSAASFDPRVRRVRKADARAGTRVGAGHAASLGEGHDMIILGVILLVLGFILNIPILSWLGGLLIVVGVVFWILGATGRAVAGRKYWF